MQISNVSFFLIWRIPIYFFKKSHKIIRCFGYEAFVNCLTCKSIIIVSSDDGYPFKFSQIIFFDFLLFLLIFFLFFKLLYYFGFLLCILNYRTFRLDCISVQFYVFHVDFMRQRLLFARWYLLTTLMLVIELFNSIQLWKLSIGDLGMIMEMLKTLPFPLFVLLHSNFKTKTIKYHKANLKI